MKVIDASVAVKGFTEEHERDAAMEIIRSGELLAAPDLVVVEVLNVLRRKHRQRLLRDQQLVEAAQTMTTCFSRFMSSAPLAQEAVGPSTVLDHSVYDRVSLACSLILDVPSVTEDHVFADKVLATRSGVHVLTLDVL